ncbi:MAG: MBL fold metallo-hydrolase [Betaproteobacteria bacterium]|nr:MBL fold metallo-hydrolase [Betaproteobacteria bacterium]
MRFAALGSGSQGNGLVVEHDGCRLLIDCGFSVAETSLRLARLGLEPKDLSAVLVTHEHDDHIGGVARLAAKFALPVWMTPGTLRGMERRFQSSDLNFIQGYRPFSIGGLHITPFPVPHDAREPAQFVFTDGKRRLGLLTDAGSVTPHMVSTLTGCDALLLECNHDAGLLQRGRYPAALKQRISGRWGHLDNVAAMQILREVDPAGTLRTVVAMHLSEENNHPDLVTTAIEAAARNFKGQVCVAYQDAGTPWLSIA